MKKRPINLQLVREALAELDRLAKEHPQLIEKALADWTADDVAAVLGEPKDFFTVEEVAEMFGRHPESVRRAIRSGHIKAGKVGGAYKISRHDLEAHYQQTGGDKLFGDAAGACGPKKNPVEE
jgi:excisionase family DNA binding protein